MSRTVLLLRAVNVGGHGKVPMARLREVLVPELGDDVSTYIASGNVICAHPSDARAACARVRTVIATEFGVDTPVILRTHEALRAAVAHRPFDGSSDRMLHAMFLEGSPRPGAVETLRERLVPGEQVGLVGQDLWIDYGRSGVQGTKLTRVVLDRALGVSGTARNLRTTRKLIELTA